MRKDQKPFDKKNFLVLCRSAHSTCTITNCVLPIDECCHWCNILKHHSTDTARILQLLFVVFERSHSQRMIKPWTSRRMLSCPKVQTKENCLPTLSTTGLRTWTTLLHDLIFEWSENVSKSSWKAFSSHSHRLFRPPSSLLTSPLHHFIHLHFPWR